MARRRKTQKQSSGQPSSRRGGLPLRATSFPKNLPMIHAHAAGIDVGSRQHYVAVPEGRDETTVRCFGSFTQDLDALADWLAACGIETIAMEATGVYWIPLFELLERRGFEVKLVEPRRLKNVPGRKTDVVDCQWIQRLHSYGLLEGSFRPLDQICELRCYLRQREMLVRYAGQHVQHMQKALEQMNVKLTEVIDDITGVTGMSIIDAILAGERRPHQLANLRDHRCKNNEQTIALALEGNWRDDHLFELRQAVCLYRVYHEQIAEVDEQIEQHVATFADHSSGHQLPQRPLHRRLKNNEPRFDMRTALFKMIGMDLTEIKGFSGHMLLGIVSEVGLDMSAWPTEKHFASWLCLCPGNHKTGGRTQKSKTGTRKSRNRAASLFRLAAQSLLRADCALGAFGRRLRARLGAPKAITAVAHKMAKVFYNALKYGKPYIDVGAATYERRYRDRMLKNLRRRAEEFGFDLIPTTAS